MFGREEMRADNVLLVITAVRGDRRTVSREQGAGRRMTLICSLFFKWAVTSTFDVVNKTFLIFRKFSSLPRVKGENNSPPQEGETERTHIHPYRVLKILKYKLKILYAFWELESWQPFISLQFTQTIAYF